MAETDTPGTPDSPGAAPNQPFGATPQVRMLGHFVRDLSFENVGAMQGNFGNSAPEVSVQVNLDGQAIGEDRCQVNMKLSAKSVSDDATRFLIELDYSGVFSISGATDVQKHPLMFIECPRLLLPFARRVVADVTRDGGYPPLMLENIDFATLYRQKLEEFRKAQAQQDAQGQPERPN